MNLWCSLRGIVDLSVTSADISGAMQTLIQNNIPLMDVKYENELIFRISVQKREMNKVMALLQRRGDQIEILSHRGMKGMFGRLRHRPILMMGMVFIFLLSCIVPTRVFFMRVEGNSRVSSKQILEIVQQSGVGFGASRREVRSEQVKNKLLVSLPELQWVGINTVGCTAVISVQERKKPEQKEPNNRNSIIASRDGIIRELTVLQGNALCQVGQVVKKGQLLVSPYTDCGIYIRFDPAKALIFGQTQHRLTAVLPTEYRNRSGTPVENRKYSLIIGKKRINLFKGSGISGKSCAKIYEKKYVTLPGGFVLPIAIICETEQVYETHTAGTVCSEDVLTHFALWYITTSMQGGKIEQYDQIYSDGGNFCRLDGIYDCYEMIGISRAEEK